MAEIGLSCPHCNQELSIDTAYAGQAVGCPHCAGEFTVPDMPAAPAAPKLAAPPQLIAPATGAPAQPPVPQQPPTGAPQLQQPQYPQQPQPGYAPPGQAPYPGAPAPAPGGYAPPMPGGPTVGIGAVIANPADSQADFIQANGPGGTSRWGWILFSTFIVVAWLFAWRMGSMVFSALISMEVSDGGRRSSMSIEFKDHVEWIIGGAIPLIMLTVVFLLYNASRSTKAKFGSIVFTASVAFVPLVYLAVFMMLLSFINVNSVSTAKILGHISIIVMVFALGGFILSIKASLVYVIGFTRKAAYWTVPATLLAMGYLSYWATKILSDVMN